jgi:hypothetical protein
MSIGRRVSAKVVVVAAAAITWNAREVVGAVEAKRSIVVD